MTSQITGPRDDAAVAAFWGQLGIPGAIDLHVHFMPERVLRKVWSYFDRAETAVGMRWPIAYREDEDARVGRLADLGVRRFGTLAYAHRPGMAAWLNEWLAAFATRVPAAVHSATFHCEPEADADVARALEAGARLFKVHLQVGAFDPRDMLLRPVWRRLAAAGVPVVVHAGSGPQPGPFTGPDIFAEVLAAHPDLVAVIAHMGMPEYRQFWDLALRHANVHLDTTMAFTDFAEGLAPFPRDLVPELVEHPGRVVLGTDFPNIPYSYAHQLAALAGLGLGADWLADVCWNTPARLLGPGADHRAPADPSPSPQT